MKILFVTDLYPLENDDCAKALYYFVREWKNAGHEVEVIRPCYLPNTVVRGRRILKEKVYDDDGIKVYNLNFLTPFWFNVYNKLPRGFSLEDYDVLISHMPCGGLFAAKLLKKHKIKYVCGVHASDITVLKDFKYSLYFKNALKKAYLRADKIAARSPVLQSKIEQILPQLCEKTFVAYSGLDEKLRPECAEIKPFDNGEVRLVTAASLIKRKNVDIIIKALHELNNPVFKLTIIGEGKEKTRLEELVKKSGLGKSVIFTGALQRKDVIKILQKSDVFALLSENETFGLVYIEAMSAGNIVIGTENDGISGILRNAQNGFLIKPDKDELVKILNKIINMNENDVSKIKIEAYNTVKSMTMRKAAEDYLLNIR